MFLLLFFLLVSHCPLVIAVQGPLLHDLEISPKSFPNLIKFCCYHTNVSFSLFLTTSCCQVYSGSVSSISHSATSVIDLCLLFFEVLMSSNSVSIMLISFSSIKWCSYSIIVSPTTFVISLSSWIIWLALYMCVFSVSRQCWGSRESSDILQLSSSALKCHWKSLGLSNQAQVFWQLFSLYGAADGGPIFPLI